MHILVELVELASYRKEIEIPANMCAHLLVVHNLVEMVELASYRIRNLNTLKFLLVCVCDSWLNWLN